jgi:hypothetical protein
MNSLIKIHLQQCWQSTRFLLRHLVSWPSPERTSMMFQLSPVRARDRSITVETLVSSLETFVAAFALRILARLAHVQAIASCSIATVHSLSNASTPLAGLFHLLAPLPPNIMGNSTSSMTKSSPHPNYAYLRKTTDTTWRAWQASIATATLTATHHAVPLSVPGLAKAATCVRTRLVPLWTAPI